MFTYLSIMLLAFVVSLLIDQKNKKNLTQKIICFVCFNIMLLPHALRYGIGTDYFYTYVPHFNGIAKGTLSYNEEFVFTFFNKLVYILTNGNYKILFFLCSLITFYFIFKIILEKSVNVKLSILLIFASQFYFYSMNMVRQTIAIVILFYGMKFLVENKKKYYIILCLLASTIHSTALFMIPLCFFSDWKINKKIKIVLISILLLGKNIVGNIFKYIIVTFTSYGWYYESQYMNNEISTILIAVNIIVFILDLIYINNNEEDKQDLIMSNYTFFGMCILTLSSSIPLVDRLVRYFTITQIIHIPRIIVKEKKAKRRIALYIIIVGLFLATMVYQIFILGGEGVMPYKSIFNIS